MWGKMSPHEILAAHVVTFTKLWQISVTLLKETSFRLLSHMASPNTFLLNRLCRGDSASTTGTLGMDVERKTHLRTKLRENGILLPCKKHLTMLITIFLQVASTQAARFSSSRTLSTLTSVSNLSTFMTQGEACQVKSLKVNKDGCCKEFFHALHFAVPHQWPKVFCSVVPAYMPKRKASPRSSFLLFVPS